LILLALVVLALAGKHHSKSKSGDNASSSNSESVDAQPPTYCAIYPDVPVADDEEEDSPQTQEYRDDDSTDYFYDPGQFMPNGGFFSSDLGLPTYYFSFCSQTPNSDSLAHCKSSDVSVCAVADGVGIALGNFGSVESLIEPAEHKKGFSLRYASSVSAVSGCANGTYARFVLNCSRNFDPETNYTVTSTVLDDNRCGITFYVNTPAGCPIALHNAPRQPPNFRNIHAILMIAGIVSLAVLVCSCCILCCVCRKVARERCARNKSGCAKKAAAAPAPKPVVAAAAPRQPQPPVTPPPQNFPGYFVAAPQGMNPMYPNLHQGGYMPLVPMMQAPQMPAQNPFAQVNNNHVAQRSHQEAEDERLARALQAQFNQEQA